MLDGLKLEVLAGTVGPAALTRLKAATAGLWDGSGDPGAGRRAGRNRAPSRSRNRQNEPAPLSLPGGLGHVRLRPWRALRCKKRYRNSAPWPSMQVCGEADALPS